MAPPRKPCPNTPPRTVASTAVVSSPAVSSAAPLHGLDIRRRKFLSAEVPTTGIADALFESGTMLIANNAAAARIDIRFLMACSFTVGLRPRRTKGRQTKVISFEASFRLRRRGDVLPTAPAMIGAVSDPIDWLNTFANTRGAKKVPIIMAAVGHSLRAHRAPAAPFVRC